MGRKRRGLSAEDKALWSKVAESITPRRPDRPVKDAPEPKVGSGDPAAHHGPKHGPKNGPAHPPVHPPKVPAFRIGERAQPGRKGHDLAPPISETMAQQPVTMDRKAFGRMKRGKLVPEARLDLHGMTMDQAHPALTRFIQESYARGFRLVLVITGKGKDRDAPGPMPVPRGILKHQVPHWLASGPLRLLVLQVTEAHLRHGGTGAYYVYLRRHK